MLVSRTEDKLEAISKELEHEHGIQAKVKSKDLSKSTAPSELYDKVIADGIEIAVLVNNAGFGLSGAFVDLSADQQMELLQLNITSLTILCKLFGSDMVKRRSGFLMLLQQPLFTGWSSYEHVLCIKGICSIIFRRHK